MDLNEMIAEDIRRDLARLDRQRQRDRRSLSRSFVAAVRRAMVEILRGVWVILAGMPRTMMDMLLLRPVRAAWRHDRAGFWRGLFCAVLFGLWLLNLILLFS